jgi:HPt (histidine-containing phosphotransfer) domain-containing protein
MAALWVQFEGATMARVAIVEQAARAWTAGTLDDGPRRRAEREAHALAGALGTFGFAEGSRVAREIELLLGAASACRDGERLGALAAALRRALEPAPARGADAA